MRNEMKDAKDAHIPKASYTHRNSGKLEQATRHDLLSRRGHVTKSHVLRHTTLLVFLLSYLTMGRLGSCSSKQLYLFFDTA